MAQPHETFQGLNEFSPEKDIFSSNKKPRKSAQMLKKYVCTNLVYLNIIHIAMETCVNRTQSQQFSIFLSLRFSLAAACRLITLYRFAATQHPLSPTSILFKFHVQMAY